MYSVTGSIGSVSAAQDLAEILAASGKPIRIHEIRLSQATEEGDAAADMLNITLKRNSGGTSGSGGTSVTPTPLQPSEGAASATAEIDNSTALSAGTNTSICQEAFNAQVGWFYLPTPECRPEIPGGQYMLLTLDAAPNATLTMYITINFEEFG